MGFAPFLFGIRKVGARSRPRFRDPQPLTFCGACGGTAGLNQRGEVFALRPFEYSDGERRVSMQCDYP